MLFAGATISGSQGYFGGFLLSKVDEDLDENWSLIIHPQRPWWDFHLMDLWRYRYLVKVFVKRDFISKFKQTLLGPLWHIINPVISTVIFTIIFGQIARLPTDGIPPFLFYMTGTTVWNYFAACLNGTSNTFVANAGLFGKVYFPRLAVPISVVISELASFAIRFVIMLGFLIYFLLSGSDIHPNIWILSFPALLIIMAGMGLGLGIIVSSLTTKYRDLQILVSYGVSLLMYATPVIYPLSSVPQNWRWFIFANPMTPIIETFRYALLGAGTVSPAALLYSAGFTLGVLLTGIFIFNRVEATFMDTV